MIRRGACRPFVPINGEKADAGVGQERTPVLRTGSLGGILRPNVPGDVVEQALQKRPQLAVSGRPIATRVGLNGLIQMTERRDELEGLQKLVNLVVGLGKLDLVG